MHQEFCQFSLHDSTSSLCCSHTGSRTYFSVCQMIDSSVYGDGDFNFKTAYSYLVIINNISQAVSIRGEQEQCH